MLLTRNEERITKSIGKYDELKRKLTRFRKEEQQQIDPITKIEDVDFEKYLNILFDELDYHEQEEKRCQCGCRRWQQHST